MMTTKAQDDHDAASKPGTPATYMHAVRVEDAIRRCQRLAGEALGQAVAFWHEDQISVAPGSAPIDPRANEQMIGAAARRAISENNPTATMDNATAGAAEPSRCSCLATPVRHRNVPIGALVTLTANSPKSIDEQLRILADAAAIAESVISANEGYQPRTSDRVIAEIFDHITDPLIVVRPDLTIKLLNTAAETLISGVIDDDAVTIVGGSIARVFPPTMASVFTEMIGICRSRHVTAQRRYYWPTLGRWFSAHAYPLQDGTTLRLHDINDLKQDEDRLSDEASHLEAVIQAQRDITRAQHDLTELTQIVAERAARVTQASGATLELLHDDEIICEGASGVLADRIGQRCPTTSEQAHDCFSGGSIIRIDDVETSDLPDCDLAKAVGARSMMLAPLYENQLYRGLLRVVWTHPQAILDRDVQTLQLLTTMVAATLARVEDFETKQRLLNERTDALNALRESEESFQKVFAEAAVGEMTTSLDGRFLHVNRAFRQITGYSEDELKATSMLAITHPDDVDISAERYRQLIDGAVPYYHLETRYLRKDGREVSVLLSSSVARDALGNPLYVIGLVEDVTERKLAEERQREAEARYRSLVEHVPAVIYIAAIDEQSTTVYVSPQITTLLGFSPREWLKDPGSWLEALHPDDRDRMLEQIVPTSNESTLQSEYRLKARDGNYVWVRDEAILILDYDGEPLYWQGFLLDITERKTAEAELVALEAQYRSLVDNANDFIIMYEASGKLTFVNHIFMTRFGYSYDEALELTIFDLIHPDDSEWVRDYFGKRRRGEEVPESFQMKTVTSDGSIVHVDINTSPILNGEGKPVAIQAIARDVSERYLSEQLLAESEQRYRSLFYHNPDAVFSLDPRGRCLTANPACEAITGYTTDEILSRPWSNFIVEEDLVPTLRHFARTVRGEPQTFELSIFRNSGDRARLSVTTLPIMVGGEIVGIYGIAKDETERRALEEQLAHQAFHDTLTHLPNRMLFLDRLQHALSRAERSETMLAVLFLDLDNFKLINDSLGHEVGDQLLINVADRLRRGMRTGDTAARLGGDEFILLLEELHSVHEAEHIAQRIHDVLKEPFDVRQREIFVTPSIGIAVSTSTDDRPDDLLRNADVAMYRAKRNGRSCYELFDPLMHTHVMHRLELERDLRQAIEFGQFVLHYQPKLDLASGRIVEMEALVRWQHPEQGMIFPGEFIPLAEETGLVIPIGHWVIHEACRQIRDWQLQFGDGAPDVVSVNLSAVQLRMPDLVENVDSTLHQFGLDPSCLCLEITESAVMDNADLAMTTLAAFRRLGVHLAIDDFGTGYSSLSYLKRFPVDILKVDRTFIEELNSNEENTVIVGITIRLAHALGMLVVAEGVETKVQLERLRDLECDLAQGYYVARPLPAESVSALIGSGTIR